MKNCSLTLQTFSTENLPGRYIVRSSDLKDDLISIFEMCQITKKNRQKIFARKVVLIGKKIASKDLLVSKNRLLLIFTSQFPVLPDIRRRIKIWLTG